MGRYLGDGQCSEEYVQSSELANLYLASAHCIGWETEKGMDPAAAELWIPAIRQPSYHQPLRGVML
jgi:hypothetical protein